MKYGKFIVRYVDTGEVMFIPKRPRQRLCRTCHAYATWALQEEVQATIITLKPEVKRQIHLRSTFYCAYHIKIA